MIALAFLGITAAYMVLTTERHAEARARAAARLPHQK